MKTFSSEKMGNLWNHVKLFFISEMNIEQSTDIGSVFVQALAIVSTFNQQLSHICLPICILFGNADTFWPICRILFAGIYQSGIPDTLSPDSYILWKSWRQISINLSFNILAGFCWFITLSTVNLNLAPKLNPDSMERMEGKIQSAN